MEAIVIELTVSWLCCSITNSWLGNFVLTSNNNAMSIISNNNFWFTLLIAIVETIGTNLDING